MALTRWLKTWWRSCWSWIQSSAWVVRRWGDSRNWRPTPSMKGLTLNTFIPRSPLYWFPSFQPRPPTQKTSGAATGYHLYCTTLVSSVTFILSGVIQFICPFFLYVWMLILLSVTEINSFFYMNALNNYELNVFCLFFTAAWVWWCPDGGDYNTDSVSTAV